MQFPGLRRGANRHPLASPACFRSPPGFFCYHDTTIMGWWGCVYAGWTGQRKDRGGTRRIAYVAVGDSVANATASPRPARAGREDVRGRWGDLRPPRAVAVLRRTVALGPSRTPRTGHGGTGALAGSQPGEDVGDEGDAPRPAGGRVPALAGGAEHLPALPEACLVARLWRAARGTGEDAGQCCHGIGRPDADPGGAR